MTAILNGHVMRVVLYYFLPTTTISSYLEDDVPLQRQYKVHFFMSCSNLVLELYSYVRCLLFFSVIRESIIYL